MIAWCLRIVALISVGESATSQQQECDPSFNYNNVILIKVGGSSITDKPSKKH